MFTAAQLVAFVISMIGMPYWYGCCVYQCTQSRLESKARQYPEHYKSVRMPKYMQAIAKRQVCMDCIGMIKGFFWTNGGKGVVEYINGGADFRNSYSSNGCPDRSANGMLSWIKSQGCKWGGISTLPETPGALLFMDGHVGVYIGGGYAVEARGFNHGVVKTKVSDRPWKRWGLLPESLLRYDGQVIEQPETSKEYKFGDRLLKRTSPLMEGADVKELQTRLNALGYACGTADGEFGKNTENGVRAFQKAAGIEVDGKFGGESFAALKAAEEEKTASYTEYTVKSGDCLWKIAKDHLGSGSRYPEIVELNGLKNAVLKVGQKLKIPKK